MASTVKLAAVTAAEFGDWTETGLTPGRYRSMNSATSAGRLSQKSRSSSATKLGLLSLSFKYSVSRKWLLKAACLAALPGWGDTVARLSTRSMSASCLSARTCIMLICFTYVSSPSLTMAAIRMTLAEPHEQHRLEDNHEV